MTTMLLYWRRTLVPLNCYSAFLNKSFYSSFKSTIMKAFLLLVGFGLAACQVFGQTDLFKSKPRKVTPGSPRLMFSPNMPLPENLNKNIPYNRSVLQSNIIMQRLGAINATTDLYKIGTYNMPCIAPSTNIKNNMPVVKELQKSDALPVQTPSGEKEG